MPVILSLLAVLAAAGGLYQFVGARRAARSHAPPGALIDIDGHRLHMVCAGDGSPAVVFESGIATSSLSWARVLREVAAFTRACALWGGIQVSRLGGLLARLGVVRVCLALLRGGAPGVPRHFVRIFGPTTTRTLERLVGEVQKLPPEVHPVVQEIWCQPKCFQAMAAHLGALDETAATACAVTNLPDVPVVIISAGNHSAATIAAHQQLARLSAQGRHVVAAKSGHWIQFDQPELVVETIREIVDRARRPQPA